MGTLRGCEVPWLLLQTCPLGTLVTQATGQPGSTLCLIMPILPGSSLGWGRIVPHQECWACSWGG